MGTSCCKQEQSEKELQIERQDTDVQQNQIKNEGDLNTCLNMTKESLEKEIKTLDFKEVDTKTVAKEETEQAIKFLNYNMLDSSLIAKGLLKNPDLEYSRLKKASHELVEKGKEELLKDNYREAKNNFALTYQTRCCCDWIWTHKLYDKEKKKLKIWKQKPCCFCAKIEEIWNACC